VRDVSLHLIQAGFCRHPQIMTIRDGSFLPTAFPALSMLIFHPDEGPVLFDTGYDPMFFEATHSFPERLYRWVTPVTLDPGEALATQLERYSVAPTEIKHIVISHFHADHIAGMHSFPNAKIHCAKSGLKSVCSRTRWSAVRHGTLQSLVPSDIDDRASFFEDKPLTSLPHDFQPFEYGVDILGDGSLLAVDLPGHCPGHWGLGLRTEDGNHSFLVADAAWSTDAIRRNIPPPAISSSFLGKTRSTRNTLGMLHALQKGNEDIFLVPSHCPECAKLAER